MRANEILTAFLELETLILVENHAINHHIGTRSDVMHAEWDTDLDLCFNLPPRFRFWSHTGNIPAIKCKDAFLRQIKASEWALLI